MQERQGQARCIAIGLCYPNSIRVRSDSDAHCRNEWFGEPSGCDLRTMPLVSVPQREEFGSVGPNIPGEWHQGR